MFGVDLELAVIAFGGGDPGIETDRHRHHVALVVIGVLADEIDAAGRAKDLRAGAEKSAEAGEREIAGRFGHGDAGDHGGPPAGAIREAPVRSIRTTLRPNSLWGEGSRSSNINFRVEEIAPGAVAGRAKAMIAS